MRELVFDLQRFADKITYDDSTVSFLKVLADLDKKIGLQDLVAFLEADKNNSYNTKDFSATIKFLGALYKTIAKDTPLNDGAVLISTIIDIVKESVQISVDIDTGKKSTDEIKKSVVKLVSKYTTALDKLTKLTNHKTSFLAIVAAAVALSANFVTSLDVSTTDEEARAQLSSLLKDEVNLAKEVLNTCMKTGMKKFFGEKLFGDDMSASLFNGKIIDNDITAPLGAIALASSAFTGIISGVMSFFDEVEHYKEDGIPEDIAIKDAILTAVATAVKETANKYTKGFDDVAFKVLQNFMSFVTQNEVDELFADKSYTELIVENFKTFNYTNTGTADDNELVSYENGKMIYGYDGNDYIGNIASNVTIFGGHDNDTIFSRKGSGAGYSTPQSNSILGGPGNDWLIAYDINSSVYGGTGDDRIAVYGTKNKIFGEEGKDAILFGDGANNNTVNGGLGDDIIILESVKNAVIEYTEGDDNDIVLGYDESDIISITGEYSTQISGADVIIVVGSDSITLNEAAGKNININNKRSVIGDSSEGGATTLTTLPSIWNDGVKIIRGTNGDDEINNTLENAMIVINALSGDDTILNGGDWIYSNNVTINAGKGDDSVYNWSSKVLINGGDGNDTLGKFNGYHQHNVTIIGGNGDDVIGGRASKSYLDGGNGNDKISNFDREVTIYGGTGNDNIFNNGEHVLINGGDGNDSVYNEYGEHSTIHGGAGNDRIINFDHDVTINGDAGNDSILTFKNKVTIEAGKGNDTIEMSRTYISESEHVLIDYAEGDGDDVVYGFSSCDELRITSGAYEVTKNFTTGDAVIKVGNGFITLKGVYYSALNIVGTLDTTTGGNSSTSTTTGGNSSTSTTTGGNSSTSTTTGGNSSTSTTTGGNSSTSTTTGGNSSTSTTTGGNSSTSTTTGGNSSTSTTTGGNSSTSTTTGGNSSTSTTTGGSSTSTTTGGSSTSTTTGGNSSTSTTTGGSSTSTTTGGSSTSTTTGGSSTSTTTGGNSSTSTTTGGSSTSTTTGGNSSTSTTTGGNSSTSTTTGGSSTSTTTGGNSSTSTTWGGNSSTSTNRSGSSSSTSAVWNQYFSNPTTTGSSSTSTTTSNSSISTTRGGSSSTSTTRGGTSSTSTPWGGNSSTSTTTGSLSTSTTRGGGSSTSTVDNNQIVYAGGNQVISNYSGQAVTLGAFTDANFNGNNFVVNSTTGSLVIENVTDKIVDLRDSSGNSFIKAYTASTAGVIDGRGIAGFEIIKGSSAGTDVIFAGDGGSSLWGGSGDIADALVGGGGTDIFSGGRFQGSDNFYNVSSADAVNLTDATLSDIVAAVENGGNILIGFNTGNIISIQSTDTLSAAINLADGSSWRFNHTTKAWQSA